MASVSGRTVRWYCPITGKQKSRTLSTEKEAKLFANRRDKESRLYRDGYLDADQLQQAQTRVIPITELVERYTEDLEQRDISQGHRRDLLGNLDRALTRIGVRDVRDLTKERVRRFLKGILDKGNSARSHNAYRSVLLDFCGWLKAYDHIKQIPVVSKPKNPSKDPRRPSRALTATEADALVKCTPDDRRKTLYLFRLRTGVRCREAARIKWTDVDLRHRTLNLPATVTKNSKPDRLPLTDDICDALVQLQREALRQGKSLGDHPFPAVPGKRTWARDLDKAKIKPKTDEGQADPKGLRKTFDSLLLLAGIDPIDVTLLMRHRPPAGMALTLGTYGDPNALLRRKRSAIDRMMSWIETQRALAKTASG